MPDQIVKLPETFDLKTLQRSDAPRSATSPKKDRVIDKLEGTASLPETFDFETIHRYDLPLSAERPLLVKSETLSAPFNPLFNMHYAFELGIVLSGKIKRHYQHWSGELSAGDIWLCGIWEPHCFEILTSPCRIVMYMIAPEMLAMTHFPELEWLDWRAPFTAPPQQRPCVKANRRDIILALGRRIIKVLEKKDKAEKLRLRLLLLETMLELCVPWQSAPGGRIASGDSFAIVNRAVEMVFKSRELIPVYEVSKVCGLSEPVFSRLFAQMMGISFADFSLRYRLSGAKEQLIRSPDPIKLISTQWGFADKSHFHHVFVQHYGCTPNAFRKRHVQAFN